MPEVAGVERKAIARRASIVALGTLASRVLGLVREQVLAAMFTRAATDIFFVAFLIPNVLRQLLAEGAVQNGVLPVLTQVREREGEAAAQRFFRALRGVSWLLLTLVSVLGVLLAPWLVELFAAGFKRYPGKFERTVEITRWVFPYLFFIGTAAMGVAALNTYRRFVVSSFAPALLNVAFIAAGLLLPTWFATRGHDPLFSLVVGVMIGGVLQVLAQFPSLRKIGYLASPLFDLTHPAVREVTRRMVPVLFGFGVYYVDVVAARHLLSQLEQGAPSYFTFAQRLCDFPQGIFVMAVQTATLPSLATLAARRDDEELCRTFEYGLRLTLFVAIPATLLLAVLSTPIVAMLFERGQFDHRDTIETGRSLLAQGSGIWTVAAVRQLVIVYYALGDTRSPVIVAAIDFIVFITLALVLREWLGHVGIAWAVSAASAVQMLLLGVLLARKLPGIRFAEVFAASSRTLLASLLAAAVALAISRLFLLAPDGHWLARLLPGAVGSLAFVAVFLLSATLLGVGELKSILRRLLNKWPRRPRVDE